MSRSDDELLVCLRADIHDAVAWQELVDRHRPRVWREAMAQVQDHELARDVTQTVWFELTRYIQTAGDDSLGGWLVTVARNAGIKESKKHRRAVPIADAEMQRDATADDAHQRVDDLDRLAAMRRAMVALSESCQQLLGLLYSDDWLSYKEIAARIDRPIGSIGPTRERCLDELRKLYQKVER